MKKICTVLILLGTLTVSAQVKIGDNPTTINANSLLELESTNKGLLIPRVALTATNNVAPFSAHTAGMLVYNTATAGTVPNNVTPGFYYNDGSSWTRVVNGPAGTSGNIYTADGTLTGNRTVTQGANTLSFTSTATNGFSVDGSTFSVDAANNAVGFGTASPNANAVVDATAVNKGVLLPRVALSATNNASPLSAFVAGMTVYNTATAGSGSTAVIPGLYFSDGTKWLPANENYSEDKTIGSIAIFPYGSVPFDYLECNGAAVSRTTYAGLFAKIGTTYGAGNGSTTFNLPDLRGEFVRGWDNGRGVDAGRTLGSSQVDATSLPNTAFTISTVGDHIHSVDPPSTSSSTDGSHSHTTGGAIANGNTNGQTGNVSGANFGLIQRSNGANTTTTGVFDVTADEPSLNSNVANHYHTTDAQGNHSHTVDIAAVTSSAAGGHNHTLSGGDAETRPRNVAMVYAIKAVESVLVPTSTSSAVSAAAAANEPWFKVGTSTGATSNTDNVYLMGNVGIGTSSPGGQLSNTAGSINHLNSLGGGLNYNASLYWRAPSTSGAGNVAQFVNEVPTGGAAGVAIKTYANDAGTPALDVSRGTGLTSGTPLFNVLTTGNVGVGTNTPGTVVEIVNNNTGNDTKDDFVINTFGSTTPGISLSKSGGTQSSPSNLTNGTTLGDFSFGGRWGGALNNFGGSKIVSFYRGNGTTGLTDLQFWTSNTQRMTVDENGNVGIGTGAPSRKLSVVGDLSVGNAGGGAVIYGEADAGQMAIYPGKTANKGAYALIQTAAAGGDMILTHGDYTAAAPNSVFVVRYADNGAIAEHLLIDKVGNVGIGTSTPNAPLQFANTIANRKIVLWEATNNDNQYFGFGINNSTLRYQVNTTTDSHVFYAGTSATTSNELMRITGAGLVGIGTASPATRLCNTNINYLNSQGNGYTTGTLHWGSSEGGNIASFINTGTGPGLMVKVSTNSNTAALDVSRGSATTAGTSLFMVAGNGYVGVGNNAPNTKLDLSGAKPGYSAGTGGSSNGPAYAIIPGGSGGSSVQNDFPSGWGGGLSTYDVVGASTYFSNYVTRSDSTLKKDIQTMGNPIVENFMKIRPVTYLMKEQTPEMAGLQYGFIAQEIGELFPSLVTTKSDLKGTIGMNYQGLIAPTVYMVQQQQQEIEAQKNTIEKQQEQLEEQTAKLNNLQKQLDNQQQQQEIEAQKNTIEKQQEQLEEQTAKLNNLQKQMDVMMGQLQALQNGAKETSAPTVSLSR